MVIEAVLAMCLILMLAAVPDSCGLPFVLSP